ncbi:MAG: usg protein [Reyranellaceae bacterium]
MSDNLKKQLRDYRLTTAEILYFLPDHQSLLQTFIWQDLDIAPKFPVLTKFLSFWQGNLDGKLHRVRIASAGLIQPAEFRFAEVLATVH